MKELKSGCHTDKCMLCTLCLDSWIPAIQAGRKNFRIEKGQTLFQEGDELEGIFFIYEGLMKVHKQWGDDKELILRFAKSGQIVGHRGLGSDKLYPVTATALERTTVCFIDLKLFNESLDVNHQFLLELMNFFAEELKESEKNMRNLAHMPVKGRIARALINLKEKFGVDDNNSINISLTRQDLASYVGTTYETLFRMLNEMIAEGLIKNTDKRFDIVDHQKLQEQTN